MKSITFTLIKSLDEISHVKNPPKLNEIQMEPFKQKFGNKKIFAQSLMPVRGSEGFRKLDYEFVEKLNPAEIISKIADHGFQRVWFGCQRYRWRYPCEN